MRGESDQRSRRSRVIMIGIAALALLTAGFLLVRGRLAGSDQADTPDSAAPYVCLECGHTVSLTAADYERIINRTNVQTADQEEPRRGRRMLLPCERCRQPATTLAAKCPKDGTVVPLRAKDNSPGQCPKCAWRPAGT